MRLDWTQWIYATRRMCLVDCIDAEWTNFQLPSGRRSVNCLVTAVCITADHRPSAAESGYNSYSAPMVADVESWHNMDPTNPSIDWGTVAAEYQDKRVAVVDDLFSPEALEALLEYTLTAGVFRTMRAGFLGAFPADGTV